MFVKIRYLVDYFGMCGNQFSFDYTNTSNIENLQTVVQGRMSDFFGNYKLFDDDVVYVQLSFRKVNIQLLSEFSLLNDNTEIDVYDFISKSVYKKLDGLSNIPVSVNESSLGKPLVIDSDHKGNINYIYLNLNNKTTNFLDIIRNKAILLGLKHIDRIISFDNSYKFYLLKDKKSNYLLAIKWLDGITIDKICYSLHGVIMNHVSDKLIGNNTISRKSSNNELLIRNNQVIQTKQDISLKAINKPKFDTKHVENPNIGTIDCETFTDLDDINKVYTLGFITNLDDKPIIYYVNNNINSHEIVLKLVDELLRFKYKVLLP